MTHLVWFRNDLRCADNPALWHACSQPAEPVIAVVYDCTQQWQKHGLGPRRIAFMRNAMLALQQQLQALNIPLLIIPAGDFAGSLNSLQRLIVQLDIRSVSFNIEYEVNERHRDIEFSRWCRRQQVAVHKFHDQCVVPPGEVLTQQDQPFKVFTPFKRAWFNRSDAFYHAPLPRPHARAPQAELQQLAAALVQPAPLTAEPDPLWPADEDHAHQCLQHFATEQMSRYQTQRDFPALDATSRLSPYLAIGLLSPRQCLHTALLLNDGLQTGGKPGIDTWINELVWREFYRHLLVAFPDLCKHKAFRPETEAVPWRTHTENFAAWCEGRTGYPIVDAAQRQLREQGWMHNRLRMISAMFLTKHLLIDWRKGEAFFNYWLMDADLASNNGGWQWSASTGADGAPYFRIFNPTSQSQKFDPQGEFIGRYVPELLPLTAKNRHEPDSFQRRQCHYPEAIVEHKFARQRALNAFKNSLNLSPVMADSGESSNE